MGNMSAFGHAVMGDKETDTNDAFCRQSEVKCKCCHDVTD